MRDARLAIPACCSVDAAAGGVGAVTVLLAVVRATVWVGAATVVFAATGFAAVVLIAVFLAALGIWFYVLSVSRSVLLPHGHLLKCRSALMSSGKNQSDGAKCSQNFVHYGRNSTTGSLNIAARLACSSAVRRSSILV